MRSRTAPGNAFLTRKDYISVNCSLVMLPEKIKRQVSGMQWTVAGDGEE